MVGRTQSAWCNSPTCFQTSALRGNDQTQTALLEMSYTLDFRFHTCRSSRVQILQREMLQGSGMLPLKTSGKQNLVYTNATEQKCSLYSHFSCSRKLLKITKVDFIKDGINFFNFNGSIFTRRRIPQSYSSSSQDLKPFLEQGKYNYSHSIDKGP